MTIGAARRGFTPAPAPADSEIYDALACSDDVKSFCHLLGLNIVLMESGGWRSSMSCLGDRGLKLLPTSEPWLLVPRTESKLNGPVDFMCFATLAK